MSQAILVLNAGSSSLKFALYRADDLAALCRGGIDGIGKIAKLKLSQAPAAVRHVSAQARSRPPRRHSSSNGPRIRTG